MKCVAQRIIALIIFPETMGLHPLKVGHGIQQITWFNPASGYATIVPMWAKNPSIAPKPILPLKFN